VRATGPLIGVLCRIVELGDARRELFDRRGHALGSFRDPTYAAIGRRRVPRLLLARHAHGAECLLLLDQRAHRAAQSVDAAKIISPSSSPPTSAARALTLRLRSSATRRTILRPVSRRWRKRASIHNPMPMA